MAFTLEYKGATRTIEAWGLSNLRKQTRSEGADSVTFEEVIAQTTSAPVFDARELIRIYMDGVQWFVGTVLRPQRSVEAPTKVIRYKVVNAWNSLERRVFRQVWPGGFSSHILLNVNLNLQQISVGAMIAAVIDYAITQGVEITKGDILPTAAELVYPPAHEVVSLTCAAVILNQMRWLLRQGIIYWDYSTENPTIHVRSARALPAVTIDNTVADAQKKIAAVEIEAREDLQLPGVWIVYEITNTVDGVPSMGLRIDFYPPTITGAEEDVLHLTFDMQGVNRTTISQVVEVEPIEAANADAATRLAWWKEREKNLGAAEVSGLTIDAVDVLRASELPNMLVSGVLAAWMTDGDDNPIEFQDEIVVAQASWSVVDTDGVTVRYFEPKKRQISARITATNAESGTYRATQSVEAGDPIPVGLARFLYELNAALQYEGRVVLKEQSLPLPAGTAPRLGTRLNITGMREEWATMNAVIQAVDEDVQRGETYITIQPVSTMAASDIMEFLRVRNRRRWTNALTQKDGTQSGNTVVLPVGVRLESAGKSDGTKALEVVKSGAGATLKKVEQNAVDGKFVVDFGAGKTLTLDKNDAKWLRALTVQQVCVKVGSESLLMDVIGSAPYRPPP